MEHTLNIEKKHYVKGFVKQSFADFKKNWKVLVLVTVLLYGIVFLTQAILGNGMLSGIAQQLVSLFLTLGVTKILLDVIDGKKISVKNMFTNVKSKQFLVVVGLLLVFMVGGFLISSFALPIVGLVALAGNPINLALLAIVIAFAVTVLALAVSLYLFAIVDKNKGVFSSLSYSWKITEGYRFRMFVLSFVSILIVFLGALALGVGLLVALPIMSLIQARLYRELAEKLACCTDDTCSAHVEEDSNETIDEEVLEDTEKSEEETTTDSE